MRSCAAPAKAALSARRFASNVPSPNAARAAFRGGQLTCCDEKTYEKRLPPVGIDARELACRLNQAARNFDTAARNLDRAAHIRMSGELLRRSPQSHPGFAPLEFRLSGSAGLILRTLS